MRFLELKFAKFLQALLVVPLFCLFLIISLLASSGVPAFAEGTSCAAKLQPTFTGAQATKLCSTFGSAIAQSLIPSATNTYDIGSNSPLKRWRDGWFSRNVDIGGTLGVTGVTTLGNNISLTNATTQIVTSAAANRIILQTTSAGGIATGSSTSPGGEDGVYIKYAGSNQWSVGPTGILTQDGTNGGNITMAKVTTGILSGLTSLPSTVQTVTGVSPGFVSMRNASSTADHAALIGVGAVTNSTNLDFFKTRAVDGQATTIVSSGDGIGGLNFYAADGAVYRAAARITTSVDTTPGSGDMPGRITFQNTPDGAASPTDTLILYNTKQAEFYGTVTSTRTTDLGWTRVNGANTACNTTCTSACVFGWDTAAPGVLLACTDATADSCLCAGAS